MPKNAQTTTQLHSSHASKVILKILQARVQQYMNCELPDVQAGFIKGRGTRYQIFNICWVIKLAREFQKTTTTTKTSTSALLTMPKSLTMQITANWKTLKEVGIPDHFTFFLRNLYASQEATVRTTYGKTNWFKIGKKVRQGCILSPYLFNLYASTS